MTKRDLNNKPDHRKGIVVGPAYDFLFEKENEEYDVLYKDYIQQEVDAEED